MTIPPLVRFGAGSWAYKGWKGLVYQRAGRDGEVARVPRCRRDRTRDGGP